MRAGRLKSRVDLQTRSKDKDAGGEQLDTWVSDGFRRADIEFISGREVFGEKGIDSSRAVKVVMRYDSLTKLLTPANRLVDQATGDIFDIQSAIPGTDSSIECLCKVNG